MFDSYTSILSKARTPRVLESDPVEYLQEGFKSTRRKAQPAYGSRIDAVEDQNAWISY